MDAQYMVSIYGKNLIGRQILTEKWGDYPGGVATVVEVAPDPEAPEIVLHVKHPTFGDNGDIRTRGGFIRVKNILYIEIDDTMAKRLEELQSKMNDPHVGEVISKAFALFSVAHRHQEEGGTIIFCHPDGRTESLKIT